MIVLLVNIYKPLNTQKTYYMLTFESLLFLSRQWSACFHFNVTNTSILDEWSRICVYIFLVSF